MEVDGQAADQATSAADLEELVAADDDYSADGSAGSGDSLAEMLDIPRMG